jgi:hypothetical protein
MKRICYLSLFFATLCLLSGCNKEDYKDLGAEYYENGVLTGYIYRPNTGKPNSGLIIYKEAFIIDELKIEYPGDGLSIDGKSLGGDDITEMLKNKSPWSYASTLGEGWFIPSYKDLYASKTTSWKTIVALVKNISVPCYLFASIENIETNLSDMEKGYFFPCIFNSDSGDSPYLQKSGFEDFGAEDWNRIVDSYYYSLTPNTSIATIFMKRY